MIAIRRYGLINAKIKTMRSFLLSESALLKMAEAQNLHEIFQLLSQSHLKEWLEEIDEESPELFESALLISEVERLKAIHKRSVGTLRHLISLFLDRYEGDRLKILLRAWHVHKKVSNANIERKIVYHFPVDAITHADSLEDISKLLHGTPFGSIVSRYGDAYEKLGTLFRLELDIDRFLYNRLWEACDTFSRKDRQIARRLLGIEIDLRNLNWMKRYQHYYEKSSAEIMDTILPHGYRLGDEMIQKFLSDGSVSDMIKIIDRKHTVEYTTEGEPLSGMEMMERFLYQVLIAEARKAFGLFPFTIATFLGYYYLMRIETKNIRSLIQMKAYGLKAEKTNALLIL